MDNLILKFKVNHQQISRLDLLKVVSGSQNYIKAKFTFTDDWNDIIKTARFATSDNSFDVILADDNTCLVPWEVIAESGFFEVSVFGGSLITADTARVYVIESGYTEGGSPEPPTPSVYEQIIEKLNEIEHREIPEEQIEKAIEDYLKTHPIESLTKEDVQRIVDEYVNAHRAEFKGDKGDKGDPGEKGADGTPGTPGADGHTPTTEEITPIVESVFDSHKSEFVSADNVKTINGESIIGKGNIEIQGGSTSHPLRVVCVSDLHINPDGTGGMFTPSPTAGYVMSHSERMNLFIDSINKEHAQNPIDALFILGDFQQGYGKGDAEYFAKHYLPQLNMPTYMFCGDHDYYSSEEWEVLTGHPREYAVTIGDYVFKYVDVYKDTYGQKDSSGATYPSTLDESNQMDFINEQKALGKQVILMCHYSSGLMGSKYTTADWRNFQRKYVTAIFEAHTHNPSVSNQGYGDLYYFNDGNFSAPPGSNWNNVYDADGNPTRRWGFRSFTANENGNLVTEEIYPLQTFKTTESGEQLYFEYERSEAVTIRKL